MTDFTPDGNELYETIPSLPSTIGHPPVYETPEQLYKKCMQYFESCKPEPLTYSGEDGERLPLLDKSGKPVMKEQKPSLAKLSLYLGYKSRQSLYDQRKRGEEFSYVIESAYTFIEGEHEENLFNPGSTGSWKWLTNHGWSDKQTVEQTIHTEGAESPEQRLRRSIMEFWSKAGKVCPLDTKKPFAVIEGGRSGGKSYNAGDEVLDKALEHDGFGTIVCAREMRNSIDDSTYPLLVDRINYHGLANEFEILDQEIRCKKNGVSIVFFGLRDKTRTGGLKGTHKLFFVWIDEAQYTSQASIDMLIPTFIRTGEDGDPPPQMLMTFNLQYESDPVWTEFVTNQARADDVLHIHIDYLDNPYLNEAAKHEAEIMRISNYPKYEHEYLGKAMTIFEDSLWPGDLIKKIVSAASFTRDTYCRVVVSCDPAETNTEFSNEYGLHVVGKTHGGEGHHIRDESGRMSPNEFASKAIRLYNEYQADAIVVETNAGGDFIKSAILTIDPTVRVREVKAKSGQGKIIRATPIANLAQMGKIRHICGGSAKLENQMARMTNQGFHGAPGESPDRVDAYVWGFIDLFGLDEMQSTELVFKSAMFKPAPDDCLTENAGVCYTAFDGEAFGGIVFDILKEKHADKWYLKITDYFKVSKDLAAETLKALLTAGVHEVHVPEGNAGNPLITHLQSLYVGVSGIDQSDYVDKKLADRIIQILPAVKEGLIVVDKLPAKTYNSESGDLFTREVTGYVVDDKTPRPILGALCNAIFVEKGLA